MTWFTPKIGDRESFNVFRRVFRQSRRARFVGERFRFETLESRQLLDASSVIEIFNDADAGAAIVLEDFGSDYHQNLNDNDGPFQFEKSGYGRLKDVPFKNGRYSSFGDGAESNPNIQVTNTTILRLGNGVLVDSVPIGQMVAIQVNFVTQALPPNAVFDIEFSMDGIPLRMDNITWATGNGSWFAWWSGWFATPGEHTLSVTVDEANEIIESNEADNSATQVFTPYDPTDLPSKLSFPIRGERNSLFAVGNYADMDPRPGFAEDFAGGIFQYDGHNAWDISPANFSFQDAGLPLIAAADGIVSAVSDGHFDRKTDWANTPANYVIINHGNGWETIYWHIARDSVVVSVGDVVTTGQVIGDMGSSGISTGTHVHFTLTRYGFPVEAMLAPEIYFADPIDFTYQPETTVGALASYIGNDTAPHWSTWREGFPEKKQFTTARSDAVAFTFYLSHLNTGDTFNVTFYRPDNSVAASWNWSATQQYRQPGFYWWVGHNFWSVQAGTWRATVSMDGVELVSEDFMVTSGAAPGQIRVSDSTNYEINHARTTPFDFSLGAGGTSTRTFRIQNVGDSPLEISDIRAPLGFTVTSAPTTPISVGGTSQLTVRFDGDNPNKSFGALRFRTTDPDVPEFWFNLEGQGTSLGAGNLVFNRPAVEYQLGTAPVQVEPRALYQHTVAPASLVFGWEGGRQNGDQLIIGVDNQGSGDISVEGSSIRYQGVEFGQRTGSGNAPENLEIVFNSSVTLNAVNALLRSIMFRSESPISGPRFLRAFIVDGNGQHSTHAYQSIRTYAPLDAPSQIEDILINEGASGRSRVESLQILFDSEVNVDPNAFRVSSREGEPVDIVVSTQLLNGRTLAEIGFLGAMSDAGSLVNGNYELVVDGFLITDAFGGYVDVDVDGVGGGSRIFGDEAADRFFRLLGDGSGDRNVDTTDYVQFRQSYAKRNGQPEYNGQYDLDGNDAVGVRDFGLLRRAFGDSMPFA